MDTSFDIGITTSFGCAEVLQAEHPDQFGGLRENLAGELLEAVAEREHELCALQLCGN
jgi:hypothetical protein